MGCGASSSRQQYAVRQRASDAPVAPLPVVEVAGYHNCPHFGVCATAAIELARRGAVKHVVIRRAGQVHSPTWADEGDRAPFLEYVKAFPRTAGWDGDSPRVCIDGEAFDHRHLMVRFATELRGFRWGMSQISWKEGAPETCCAVAYAATSDVTSALFGAPAAFSGDPPGAALCRRTEPCVEYDDIVPLHSAGDAAVEYAPFPTDARSSTPGFRGLPLWRALGLDTDPAGVESGRVG